MAYHVPVAAPYAALLALLFLALSVRVIGRRRSGKVAIGTGGDRGLERAARVHANFAEYVPFALLLMLLGEGAGLPRWLLHGAGVALLSGRLLHAWGVSQEKEDFRLRTAGMAATFAVLGVLALGLLLATVVPMR